MTTPLNDLAIRLQKAFPEAKLEFAEPATPKGVGFLDLSYRGQVLVIQWQEKWHFGLSSPHGHGYGEKPDEVYRTVDETATRIGELLNSGRTTEPPPEVTLRELRAEINLVQSKLADRLGVSQPAVSKFESHVSRMRVATLRTVIEAMGGKLVVQAHFPDGLVRQLAIDDSGSPTESDLVTIDE